MRYRCVATSVKGLVQQIATCYLRHGYWWYVAGRIPEHKDPQHTDRKLIGKYEVDVTEWRPSLGGEHPEGHQDIPPPTTFFFFFGA